VVRCCWRGFLGRPSQRGFLGRPSHRKHAQGACTGMSTGRAIQTNETGNCTESTPSLATIFSVLLFFRPQRRRQTPHPPIAIMKRCILLLAHVAALLALAASAVVDDFPPAGTCLRVGGPARGSDPRGALEAAQARPARALEARLQRSLEPPPLPPPSQARSSQNAPCASAPRLLARCVGDVNPVDRGRARRDRVGGACL
jgi:hypothetical protein